MWPSIILSPIAGQMTGNTRQQMARSTAFRCCYWGASLSTVISAQRAVRLARSQARRCAGRRAVRVVCYQLVMCDGRPSVASAHETHREDVARCPVCEVIPIVCCSPQRGVQGWGNPIRVRGKSYRLLLAIACWSRRCIHDTVGVHITICLNRGLCVCTVVWSWSMQTISQLYFITFSKACVTSFKDELITIMHFVFHALQNITHKIQYFVHGTRYTHTVPHICYMCLQAWVWGT
jgi:hypothetical protein